MNGTLNEQRLEVVQMLRAMLINGHVIKLQEMDAEIAELEKLIETEKRAGVLLNAY